MIHGPSNISRRGGAARYGQQLLQYMQGEGKESLVGHDLYYPGLSLNNDDSHSPEEWIHGLTGRLKHIIYRTMPPVLYDQLLRLYEIAGKDGSNADYKVARAAVSPWQRAGTPVLLHELMNFDIIGDIGTLSPSPRFKLVVTFLDIQDCFYPENFRVVNLNSRRLLYSYFKDRADCFLAISHFTKQTMVDRLGIAAEKIKVIHLAADAMPQYQPTESDKSWAASFGRYLLYPAKPFFHKNHAFLISALGKLHQACEKGGLQLLLTGGVSKKDIQHLNRISADNNAQNIVQILGFVSETRLHALIKGAEYLVFPSFFEGFGMPVLEAMTLGCPVLASNAGSLPEVGGDAAVYFDPRCEDELIALLDQVVQEKGLVREAMIEKGYRNCQRFSWRKTCEATTAVYKELLGSM